MRAHRHFIPAITLALTVAISSSFAADGLYEKSHELQTTRLSLKSNPNDVDLSLHMADLALETGDYELAIAPMERLSVNHPDDAKLKLKLGILYYMIGSYDVAKSYLEPLQNTGSQTPQIAQQAQTYLARM